MDAARGVDLKKELHLLEEVVASLKKEGILNQGQLDILSGAFFTKEALKEINKKFEELYHSK